MTLIEAIAQRKSVTTETVELGLDDFLPVVFVRRLQTAQMINISNIKDPNEQSMQMVIASIADDDGKPAFADSEAVRSIDYALFQALLKAAMKVNGMGKRLEDAEKN